MTRTITETSKALFLAYYKDAPNWSGTPCTNGNVAGTAQQHGNLTQLKRAGLITTFASNGAMWISFTDTGRALGQELTGCNEFGEEVAR